MNKQKMFLSVLSGALGFGFVCAVPAMLQTKGDALWYSNSVFTVLLWVLISRLFYHIYKKGFEGAKVKWVFPGIFSLLFSVCMVFGAQLESVESVTFTDVGMWLSILVLGICFAVIVRFLWETLQVPILRGKMTDEQMPLLVKREQIRSFLLTALAIFICYIPVFLAVYPGFFVYDAQDELMQVITRNFSTHHPLLHVLMLGGIIQLVYKITGSYNLGIACYTLFQAAVLSGIFSYVICHLKKEGMKRLGRICTALYFGLFPTIVMFVLCSAKDGLFTGMVLILVMMLRKLLKEPQNFFEKKIYVILLIASGIGMSLLRHNGFYALLVFMIMLIFTCKWNGLITVWKKVVLTFAMMLLGFFLLNSAMTVIFTADDSENQELLTVPIMQMARVYAYEQDSLTEEEKNTLYEILPKEALMRYTPKVSDGVKIDFNNAAYQQDSAKYLKLWVKLGVKHPFTYLNAWFMTSYGFWYPDTVIDVYRGNSVFTFTYEDSSYFGFEVEQPGERQSRLPLLEELYRQMSLEIAQHKIPVISMLFSPGFLFWVMMFVLGKFCYEKEWKKMVPYGILVLLWLTVILGPTYLVRYVVFLWFMMPVLLWDLLRGDI